MRLIDAGEIIKRSHDVIIGNGTKHRCFDTTLIHEIPTVDALPYDYILNIEEELRKKARESESQEQKEFYLQNAEAIQRLLVTWEMKGRGTVRGYDKTD